MNAELKLKEICSRRSEMLRKKILKIIAERKKLKDELEKSLDKLRKNCAHPIIIECPYKPETEFFYAEPPARRCIVCGIVENGWGCGYKILNRNPIKEVLRDDFYRKYSELRPITYKSLLSFDF